MMYIWLKALHVIVVIFWMAGLFMMPRFFVYHQESEQGSVEDKAWAEREARLLRIIMNPSMIAVWVLGMVLAVWSNAFTQGWMLTKLLLVLGLSGYHGWMVGYARKLANGERTMAGKTLRLLNEVPSIATILIVILVIVKPF
jgi:protoporphyrinogen IX oxidase